MNEKELAEKLRGLCDFSAHPTDAHRLQSLLRALSAHFSAKASEGQEEEKARENAGEGVCEHEDVLCIGLAWVWCEGCGSVNHDNGPWRLPRSQQK
jgi:hypothetical protein